VIYRGDKEPSGHHDVEQVEHRNPFRLSARMPRNSNKPWIPEDDKRLLELKAAGKSNGAIGVTLARSTGSIIGRLSVLNTRTARLKRALRRMINALLKGGAPFGCRYRGLSDGKKTRSYSDGDAADSQPERGCNAHGAGTVGAEQSGRKVDTTDYAMPS
jgi:hypothetical protein